MKTAALQGTLRDNTGKKEAKKLRKEFKVPGVIYGSKENINFVLDEVELTKLINSPDLFLIDLTVGDFKTRVIIQDVQFDPVTDRPIHVDLLEALPGKLANLSIPVEITGNSVGVLAGGQLVVKMRRLAVRGIPADMPERITVDISDLNIGKSIKIGDLEGFNFLEVDNSVIVRVKAARNMADLEPVLDEDEAEETEEGTEEGATAAAEGETKEGAPEAAEAPAAEA